MAMNAEAAATAQDLPPIVVAEEQFDELSSVAERLVDAIPEVGLFLERELDRAKLMPLARMPHDVVTIGSTVSFIFGMTGRAERLKLVWPEGNIADHGLVSLASPVGVALLGMKAGETISWSTRYGDIRSLKVLGVERER
ncbi:nucleoside diphosphate kinase regulator [Parvibaculum sp.]|uniref:nucleoside diphosphate kinase regulator n=1 Tax=Parvibaculum sp. TaxID=2024848 RepID=UPI001B24E916|nr:nucleoside diphosphate kinase regulator [Parvibaculum sp.]MBO6669278.1 nucleoside diphosphate kinase regulator [Parvibaculum sp.]MBO6693502.1 nucleoside diphosphate kinase regulator [Parvibaculum sp.]MBO6712956.1 nucleoside diphosphate kinase regulator [Parvibaculum sp.]